MQDLVAWIEQATGGRLARRFEIAGGKSRVVLGVDVEKDGELLPLVVRQETGLGPHSGTRFTLQREAATLEALNDTPIPKARFYALSPEGDAVLMQRLEGEAAMPTDPETRAKAIRGFAQGLADLHRLDIAGIDAPFLKPTRPQENALHDLADYEDSYRRLCIQHGIFDRGFDWLKDNAGTDAIRPVVVHGDAGPGNFMHDNGRLTGLIDWEMTHFGDPHDDLAWIWFRVNMIKQDVEADSYFREYQHASGLEIDRRRLIYHIVQVVMRCAVTCGVRQFHDEARDDARPKQLREMLEAALDDAAAGDMRKLPPLPAGV